MRLLSSSRLLSRSFSCTSRKLDAAYEGPGKTTVAILNEEKEGLLIDAFSKHGFVLNNGFRVVGPIALFPDAVFQWNIKSTLDVTEKSFALFEMLQPKPEIVIFGYGSRTNHLSKQGTAEEKQYVQQRDKMIARVMINMKMRKINVQSLPTEDAIGTYNYLSLEGRLVGAALIPPEIMTIMPSFDSQADNYLQYKEFGETNSDFSSMTRQELLESIDPEIVGYDPSKKTKDNK